MKAKISRLPKIVAPTGERFRQTRSQQVERLEVIIGGAAFVPLNWSRTGISFASSQSSSLGRYRLGDEIAELVIRYDQHEIHRGSAVVRNVREIAGEHKTIYGVAFQERLLGSHAIQMLDATRLLRERLDATRRDFEEIDPVVARLVCAVSAGLAILKERCEQLEQATGNLPLEHRLEAERIALPILGGLVTEVFSDLNVEIGKRIDVLALGQESPYFGFFQHALYHPFVSAGAFPRRAFEKPQGYPGDFEMMNQIYRNQFEGESLFSRLIHYWVTNEYSSESVRVRKEYFIDNFRSFAERAGPVSILALASGPALEITEFVKEADASVLERFHFTLFDLDRDALEYAQSRLFDLSVATGKPVNVDFVNASVKAFLTGQVSARSRFDLVYSAGLFDYLDNRTSVAIVQQLFAMLEPRGRLVLGNFTKANVSRAFCHLVLNWLLVHKDEHELAQWGAGLAGATQRVEYDEQRMNAFVVVDRA